MKKMTVRHMIEFINFCEQNNQDKEALINSYEEFSKIDIRKEIEKLEEIEDEDSDSEISEEEFENKDDNEISEEKNLCDQMMKKLTIDEFITFLKNR